MLKEFIERAIREAGIKKYTVKNGVYINSDWTAELKLYNDIAIVYDFSALCNITNISDFKTKNVVIIESPENRVDYKHLVTLQEVSGSVQLKSNHISIHRSSITIDTTNAVWADIYTGHFAYILIKNAE